MRVIPLFALWSLALFLSVTFSACPSEVQGPEGKGCSVSADCPNAQVCQDGACTAACTEASCGVGLCDLGTGRCVECLTSEDCGGNGRVCNDFTGRCVEDIPACTSDADCLGLTCDLDKGACVECLQDADCGLGVRCDLMSQTCSVSTSCVTDGDCTGGLVCEPSDRVCVACFNNAHCASGDCDEDTNACVAGCSDDDATEPNDGTDAVAISSGGSHEGRICAGDSDEFLVVAEGRLTAALQLDAGALLSMKLENAAGSLVATATDTGSALELDVPSLTSGTYRIVITGALADSEGAYLLAVTVEGTDSCEDVDSEPNDDNADAIDIPTDGALRSGSICGPDTDVWTFSATAGEDIDVSVTAGDGSGTLTVSLENAAGTVLATGINASADDVSAGVYFVSISGTGERAYTVRVTSSATPPACTQTDAEPNNADAQAILLNPGTVASGTICAADTDQFRFAATALDDAQITLTGAGLTARLVRASDGQQIAQGTSFSAPNLAAGGYRVVVTGNNASTEGSYTLNVTITPEPVADPCDEGGLEPDDTDPRTLPLDGTPLAGRICASDTDYFGIELEFASRLTVTARFTDADGDLDMRLVDDAGVTVDSAASVTDNETIVEDLQAGSYQVRIYGWSSAVNTYTMEATLTGCVPDDEFENNSAASKATPIRPGALAAARCPGDDDYYALRLENGDALDVTLAPTGGALTMSLVSTTGTLLQSDVANGAGRRLQTSGLAAGRYLVRVTGASADRVSYTLNPSVTPSPARCVDDGASPNENVAGAYVLDGEGLLDGSYEIGALVMCTIGDVDFFSIDLPSQKSVALQLSFATQYDVDVELLEPRGDTGFTRSISRSFATDAQDRIAGIINKAGRYTIRTVGFDTGPLPYGVGIEVANLPNQPCVDDRFDTWTATSSGGGTTAKNNDAASDAVTLSLGETLAAQRICPSNRDWYRVSLASGDTVSITVDYAHASGRDIDVRAYGPQSQTTVLATCTQANNTTGTGLSCASVGVDGSEALTFTATAAGEHFIEVYGFGTGENEYTLSVDGP
jgi:Bacterial pre-peptidase C-terminal domain